MTVGKVREDARDAGSRTKLKSILSRTRRSLRAVAENVWRTRCAGVALEQEPDSKVHNLLAGVSYAAKTSFDGKDRGRMPTRKTP